MEFDGKRNKVEFASTGMSTLKADILNITYDCYSQNNNVKMATL